MKEGKLPDPKERENEIDLGQKLQLDRDKEFSRRLKEAQGKDYVEPIRTMNSTPTSASDSSSAGSPASKDKKNNATNSNAKDNSAKSTKSQSKLLDYIIVFSVILIWLGLFVFRNYPGLLGIQPKAAVPVE